MVRFGLWFARGLRLSGCGLWIFWAAIVTLSTLDPLDPWPLPFLVTLILSTVLLLPGTLLFWIGNTISPPDPRLDYWLDFGRFRKYIKSRVKSEPAETGGVWAWFSTDRPTSLGWTLGATGKCRVEVEERYLSLEVPGKDLILLETKTISRDGNTLLFHTGRLNYGTVALTFDSASDADVVVQELSRMLSTQLGSLRKN